MNELNHILKRNASPEPVVDTAEENILDRGGWGMLRGVRDRALTLSLIKMDDTIMAVPYVAIEQFLYSHTDGITLRVGGREIKIVGRHLYGSSEKSLSLFTSITRHRVPWIAEHSRTDGPASPGDTVIESIIW